MGRDWVQIRVLMRRFSIQSVKLFYRLVCNHPFLAGLLCFVLFLYKSFPFLLSLLVTASPVLVCTAVLLGTLLSFGQPNLPEIEEEEEVVSREIAPLKAGASQDATVVERDVSFAAERFVGLGEDLIEKTVEQGSSVGTEAIKIENVSDSLVDNVSPADETAEEDQHEKGGVDEVERQLDDLVFEKSSKPETEAQYSLVGKGRDGDHDGEETENQYTLVGQERDDSLEVETDTRRQVESEEEEEDDKSSDDESDGAESSSPDASLADIIPMLDELHPLLHEGAPRPAHMPHDDSDAASEQSSCSRESDDDSEDKEDEEVDGDDEEEEEEETSPGKKGDTSTSPIVWTEDDQKNVMDLGTSEIERNQRLESLIARRKARKAITLMKHKDLIDFDGDLSFNVPHITTKRRNPFDGPDDSYADMGLPPIPGSAPSILMPRRNPFDIPYDSSEEKPDLKGDSFEEEFAGFQQKESAVFRRHESFSLGPSTLGGHRKERRDVKWKPFFVPESLGSEGTSYSSLLHRQLSEISDDKTSSVPDTESVSSGIDHDDMKLSEQDLSQERKLMPSVEHASDHGSQESQSSDDADSVHMEEIVQRDDAVPIHDEAEVSMMDLEIHPTTEAGDAAAPMVSDVNREGTAELEMKDLLGEESGISERPSLEESEFKNMTKALDGSQQQKEPVYDSNPSTFEKLLSFSSISSEIASHPALEEATVEFSDKESEMQIVNRAIDIPSDEVMLTSSSQTHEVDEIVSRSKEVAASDHDDGKVGPTEVEKDSDYDLEGEKVQVVVNQDVEQNISEAAQEKLLPSVVVEHDPEVHPHLSIIDTEPIEEPALDEVETHHSVQGQMYSSSPIDNRSLGEMKNEDGSCSPRLEAEIHPDVLEKYDAGEVEQVSMVHPLSLESDHVEEYMLDKEEAPEFEQKEVHSSEFDANVGAIVHTDLDVKVVSQSSYEDTPSEENFPSESEKKPSWSDKSMVEPSFDDDHHGLQEPSFVQTEIMDDEEGITGNVPVPEFHDCEDKVSPKPDSTLNLSKISEYESSIDGEIWRNDDKNQVHASGSENSSSVPYETHILEANFNAKEDDIKEIDEGLLSELDRVGDFCIKEVESLHTEMIQEGADGRTAEFEPLDNELNVAENNLELPAFEVRSVEDIEMAFKQLHEGVDIEELILSSSFREELDMENSVETISNFEVIDARSVKDIHVALKKVLDGNLGKSSDPLESKNGLAEDKVSSIEDIDSIRVGPDVEETSMAILDKPVDGLDDVSENSNLHVIDERSVEDVEVALKEISDGNLGKTAEALDYKDGLTEVGVDKVSSTKELDSAIVEPEVEETSMAVLDKPVVGLDEASDNSNLQVSDARSVEDIQVALKEVSDGNLGRTAEPMNFKDGLAEVEVDKLSSTEELDFVMVEPEIEETSMAGHVKSVDGLDEASGNSNLQVSDVRSVEDLQVTLKEVSDGDLGKTAEPMDFKDGLAEVEVDKVSSTKELDSSILEPEVEETSMVGLDEASDDSNLQVIDARSVEDIQVALKEVSDGTLGKTAEPMDFKDGLTEVEVDKGSSTKELDSTIVEPEVEETIMAVLDKPVAGLDEASDASNLQVIDARSMEDIQVALKEVSGGNLGKTAEPMDFKDGLTEVEVDKASATKELDSAIVEPEVEETSMAILDKPVVGLDEASDDSNLQVIDARSMEDIQVALKEVSDGNLGKTAELLDFKDELAEVEVDKVSSTEELDSAIVEPEVEGISMAVLDKSVDEVDEASDYSNFQVIDARSLGDIRVALEEVSDGDLGKSPEKLDAKDGLAEFEYEKVSSTDDVEAASVVVLDKSVDGLDEADNSNFQVINARSVDDIDMVLKEVSDGDLGKSPEPLNCGDGSAEVGVNKASCTEDLDSVTVDPDVKETSTSVIDKPVDGIDEASGNSNFQVISASSVDDIDMVLKEVSDGNLGKSPEPLDSKDVSAEIEVGKASCTKDIDSETSMTVLDKPVPVDGIDEAYDNSTFHVIARRSVDDIHVALKKVSEGNIGKLPEPLDSKDGLIEVKDDDVSSTMNLGPEPLDELDETSFQVIDARSMQDIYVDLKEVSDGNMGKSTEPLGSRDGSAEVQVGKVSSTKDLDSAKVEANVEEISMVAHDKPIDGVDETSDGSSLKQEAEKGTSH